MTDLAADHRPVFNFCMAFVASATGYAALPDPVKPMFMDQLPGPGKSWPECWVNIGELVFANREDCNAEALRLGAQCAFICRMNGFSTLGSDRGWKVQQALQREAGDTAAEGSTWPDPAADPDPLEAWIPPA